MNSKAIIAGIITAVVNFLLGWLVFGILLMDFYTKNSIQYAGFLKNPPTIWIIGVANICWGLLTAYVLNLAGVTTAAKGAAIGVVIFALSVAGYDAMIYAQTNWYSAKVLAVDVAMNAVLGAIAGGVVGFIYSRKSA